MTDIRDELCRFIRLNEQGRWVHAGDAVEQLESFGDDLVHGLIECLNDGHPDVRHLAVQFLGATRPRSNVAVPALIERMADEDWLVSTTTMFHLGEFGQLATEAIPEIEPWLESPNEFLRVSAAITIVRIDPLRTEFLATIQVAMTSDHPVAADIARDFFEETMIQ